MNSKIQIDDEDDPVRVNLDTISAKDELRHLMTHIHAYEGRHRMDVVSVVSSGWDSVNKVDLLDEHELKNEREEKTKLYKKRESQ